MRTLMVYYSNDPDVIKLCESSARRDSVDVVRLCEKYDDIGRLWLSTVGVYRALTGGGIRIKQVDADLSMYDTVIIASQTFAHSIHPAVNDFLHRTKLNDAEVYGLTINTGKPNARTSEMFRHRIRLAGGSCRSVVSLPLSELKKSRRRDIISHARQKA